MLERSGGGVLVEPGSSRALAAGLAEAEQPVEVAVRAVKAVAAVQVQARGQAEGHRAQRQHRTVEAAPVERWDPLDVRRQSSCS